MCVRGGLFRRRGTRLVWMVTVKELQALLRTRSLPVSGKKAVLIQRLADAGVPLPTEPSATASPPAHIRSAVTPSATSVHVPRDHTPRTVAHSADRLRIASWNVAGLRGLLTREEGRLTLKHLTEEEGVDVLMLQETKLQEKHVAEVEPLLQQALHQPLDGSEWHAAWSCSTARLGYSGVCTLWRSGQALTPLLASEVSCEPLAVDPEHEADREGRTLLLQLPLSTARVESSIAAAPRLGLINCCARSDCGSKDRRGAASLPPHPRRHRHPPHPLPPPHPHPTPPRARCRRTRPMCDGAA